MEELRLLRASLEATRQQARAGQRCLRFFLRFAADLEERLDGFQARLDEYEAAMTAMTAQPEAACPAGGGLDAAPGDALPQLLDDLPTDAVPPRKRALT